MAPATPPVPRGGRAGASAQRFIETLVRDALRDTRRPDRYRDRILKGPSRLFTSQPHTQGAAAGLSAAELAVLGYLLQVGDQAG